MKSLLGCEYVLSWLAFSFSTVSLEEQVFPFENSAFCILSKKSLSYNPKVAKVFILMFFVFCFPRSFVVTIFTSSSLIRFELMFVLGVR